MRRITRSAARLAGSAIAAAALLAACNNTQSPNAVLSQVEANAVAEEITTDAAGIAQGATFNSSSGAPFAVGPMMGAPVMSTASGSCTPTVTPASPANSDGDPVPDSVKVDFSGCTVTSGSYTATLGGTIDYVDPTPTITDWAPRTRHTDFSRSVTNNVTGKTRSAVENGVRMISGSADQLQFTETDFRTDYTFTTGATASHVRTWSSTFTADQAGSIQAGSPLPSGNWNITGTSTWTSGLLSYSLAVTTNPQLHYNASCTVEPRFDSGTLAAVVKKNSATTNVTVQFTACGQYTVTRS